MNISEQAYRNHAILSGSLGVYNCGLDKNQSVFCTIVLLAGTEENVLEYFYQSNRILIQNKKPENRCILRGFQKYLYELSSADLCYKLILDCSKMRDQKLNREVWQLSDKFNYKSCKMKITVLRYEY